MLEHPHAIASIIPKFGRGDKCHASLPADVIRHFTESQAQPIYKVAWNSDKNGRPAFHETPKGRAWHVEREGLIAATGFGLEACSHYGAEGAQAAAKVCDKIEAAITTDPYSTDGQPGPTVYIKLFALSQPF